MKVTKGTPNQFKAALQNQINMLEGRGRRSVQECQNIEAATEMYQKHLCLEEYLEQHTN